eukprot:TRINITY_DN36702_c0_g1_i2.p1 TRINITY_DN36702_c0_g1~~TRINITY_DN36702_c0_g1_i2.p1  ORF type:complete len:584 (-),score=54.55 TRINITY_DN36702_c0_g1_i2:31-1782(-)
MPLGDVVEWTLPELQPRGLFILYTVFWVSLMYMALLWPLVEALVPRHNVPEAFLCVGAILWQHRVRSGVASRLLLLGLSLYRILRGWLGPLSRARLLSTATATALKSLANTTAAAAGPANNTGFLSHTILCSSVIIRIADRNSTTVVMNRHPLGAFRQIGVDISAPPTACLDGCAAHIHPEAWPASSTESLTSFLFSILSWADGCVTLFGSVWTLLMLFRVETLRRFAPEDEYLAIGKPLRAGLRVMTKIQLLLALLYALLLGSLLELPWGQDLLQLSVALLCGCVAMEIAGHSLTMIAVSLLSVLAGFSLCVGSCVISAARVTVGVLFRFLYHIFTEATLDSSQELSLQSSRSFGEQLDAGEDDLCAICLCPLHPENVQSDADFQHGAHTALQRLRPRLRASVSRLYRREKLVRLSACKHAFHHDCLEVGKTQLPLALRTCCPTCRSPSQRRVWRNSIVTPKQLLDFVRDEVDTQLVFVVFVVALILSISMVAVELFTRVAEQLVTAHMWLHKEHDMSWPVLNMPLSAILLNQWLKVFQLGFWRTLILSVALAYPSSYVLWSAPHVVLLSVAATLAAYLAVT